MIDITLNLYRKDFNIVANHSCLGRIIRTIVLIGIIIFLMNWLNPKPKGTSFILLLTLFLGMFIGDRFIRRLYPDWPKKKNFVGTISFNSEQIEINSDNHKILLLENCKEMVLFYDHFAGYSQNNRDIQRNGNALLFFQDDNENVTVEKFNILNEQEFSHFERLLDEYKKRVPYLRKYTPYDVGHILSKDMSRRIIYN